MALRSPPTLVPASGLRRGSQSGTLERPRRDFASKQKISLRQQATLGWLAGEQHPVGPVPRRSAGPLRREVNSRCGSDHACRWRGYSITAASIRFRPSASSAPLFSATWKRRSGKWQPMPRRKRRTSAGNAPVEVGIEALASPIGAARR